MATPTPTPGWYPDPSGPGQRYFDGMQWTSHQVAPPQAAGMVVTGPNHALHAILSVLTFWMCGGWIWVWLIIALQNNKQVRAVDAYGRPIATPMSSQEAERTNANQRAWMIGGAVGFGLLMLIFVMSFIVTR